MCDGNNVYFDRIAVFFSLFLAIISILVDFQANIKVYKLYYLHVFVICTYHGAVLYNIVFPRQ